MTKYEYDVVAINLDKDQMEAINLGVANIDSVMQNIKQIVDEKASDGWEALYPFSVPHLWFKRPVTVRRTRKTS